MVNDNGDDYGKRMERGALAIVVVAGVGSRFLLFSVDDYGRRLGLTMASGHHCVALISVSAQACGKAEVAMQLRLHELCAEQISALRQIDHGARDCTAVRLSMPSSCSIIRVLVAEERVSGWIKCAV